MAAIFRIPLPLAPPLILTAVGIGSYPIEAWWNFASGAVDATGNGNDGTLQGTTLVAGPYNYAARSFNGTSDFIEGATSPLDA